MTLEPREGAGLDNPAANLAIALAEVIGLAITLPFSAAAGDSELIRQQGMLDRRPTLVPHPELTELIRRGEISEEAFANVLSRTGYSDSAIAALRELAESLLQPGELLALWRRELISDLELEDGLDKLGFSATKIAQLKNLAFEVASPQDVIRFTVREVFNPELRAALALDTDFPVAAEDAFKAAGLRPELARDFWAAHWELPSITLAFEMLHRKQISEDELDLILRAQDVLPLFREPIKAVAFRPLTRVDLRRMHALGLLDESELQARYEDLGFSPENAALMVEFTKAFNEDDDPDTAAETRDLTRSQITNLFAKGIFALDEAKQALADIGFSEANADTILLLEEFKLLERERDAQVKIVTGRFENGDTDFNETVAALDELGLTAQQRDLVMVELEAERISKIRLPTRAELDRFLREGLISVEEYVDELERIGIPDPWRERFAELVTGGVEV